MFDFIFKTFFNKVKKEDKVQENQQVKFDRRRFNEQNENTCLTRYFVNCKGLNVLERERNKTLTLQHRI